MREILFRGKRVDNGEWVEGGSLLQFLMIGGCKKMSIAPRGTKPHIKKDGQVIQAEEIFPETVGRYTGLTDKNGTRIFEGDIIKQVIPHNLVQPFIFTVNWCEECAMFVLPCITNDAFESDFTVMRSDEIEVIGNIHDNPELLKGE
ncbi:MAG: YopX family protein [Acutalibacteraceae bacterium]|nr:YopX family protein [Acutalibacteraceae bacterium]